MSKGGLSIFLALLTLSVFAFLVMSGIRLVLNILVPDENLASITDEFWRVFLQISDAGAVAEDGDANIGNKVVGISTVFIGLVLFSSLVAFITSQFDAKIAELKQGRSDVIESGHTIILGYTDRLVEIVKELIIANESESDAAIVILADKDKEAMDSDLRERVPDRKTTRIVTRGGSISTSLNLRKVAANRARSIIVLNPSGVAATDEERAAGDAIVLKTIMAIVSVCEGKDVPSMVVELRAERNRNLALSIHENITAINEEEILAKLLVQTSRISGLAIVYSNLVGFEGNEVYFHKPKASYGGKTFRQLELSFVESTVLGYRKADGTTVLNPPGDVEVFDSDELIILAEDDSTIKFDPKLSIAAKNTQYSDKKAGKSIEKQLLVGWNNKASIIVDQYAKYLIEGSGIDILVPDSTEEIKAEYKKIQASHPSIQMRLFKADVHAPNVIEKMNPQEYDNVILLSGDGDNAELVDAATVANLLEFRSFFKTLKEEPKTQIITEVKDSENTEIILETGVKDFLISNQFVSKIYAQVSQEAQVLAVYEDLFSPEGSEVYIKPAVLYFSDLPKNMPFSDLTIAASKRGEVCFGFRVGELERNGSENYGVIINPKKTDTFEVGKDDYLIVLAEDET